MWESGTIALSLTPKKLCMMKILSNKLHLKQGPYSHGLAEDISVIDHIYVLQVLQEKGHVIDDCYN